MEPLETWLTSQIEQCRQKQAALTADHRADEAVFEKIRQNVFDIFRTVWTAAEKQPEPLAFFRDRLTTIPANWQTSLEQARLHSNEDKAHIEQIKLDAVNQIRQRLAMEERV